MSKSMITRELPKAAERQMRNWELANAQHIVASSPSQQIHDFIAISRAPGCGAARIAQNLGDRLHWPVLDREILLAMAGADSARGRLYDSVDERDMGLFEETCRSLLDSGCPTNDYFHRLTRVIRDAVRSGPAIFVGRGADLILPRERGLRIRLTAPLDYRVRQFASRYGLELRRAKADVLRIETERDAWLKNHFHADSSDVSRYDLALNIERFSPDQVTGLILATLTMRFNPAQI